MHYTRYRKYGTPGEAVSTYGDGWIDNGGYHRIGRANRKHRIVMEQILGRKLRKDENVHHKNGVRNDNRPENLELWCTAQPAGKRPLDLLTYAYEIIARYEKEKHVL